MRRVIDGHMHTHSNPGLWFKDWADRQGLSAYALLGLTYSRTPSEGRMDNNEVCLQVKQADPKRCYFFAGLTHPAEDYKAYVQQWLARGADGVKLIETKPTGYRDSGVDLSDPQFDEMFGFLEENQIPVIWHCGDPATFWRADEAPQFAFDNGWFYGDGGFKSLEELYGITEKVLERHPKLSVCFAHIYFCGDDRAHAERLFETYPNVRLDITPGVEMYDWFSADHDGWRDFFIRYADRIQLGSDVEDGEDHEDNTFALARRALTAENFRWNDQFVIGLDLPEDVIDRIMYRNFRAFAGEKPAALK